MNERAISEIDKIQPFRFVKRDIPHLLLAILNRLNNADKHRELVPVANFLNPQLVIAHKPEGAQTYDVPPSRPGGVGGPGAEILRLDREVQVEASGALHVTVGAGKVTEGGYRLPETCETILGYIRDGVIPTLESTTTGSGRYRSWLP